MNRGLTKDGKWVYGWLFIGVKVWILQKKNKPDGNGLQPFKPIEVVPQSVGQQIGLRDNKSKEIYGSIVISGKMSRGGDIVKIPDAEQAMGVLYQPPGFIMKTKTKSGKWSSSWSEFIMHHKHRQIQEIVGNQTDNTKLL